MPRVPARPIRDEEELTQYGTTTEPFRNEPRWWKENAISLILGGWHPLAAGEKVRGWALEDGTDAARYTTAGTLRSKKFIVTHKPTLRNPDHVAVSRDGEWDRDASDKFDGCFSDLEVGEVHPRIEDDNEEES